MHLEENVDQRLGRDAHRLFHRRGLPQCRCLELGEDLVDQRGVIAAPAAVQQSHDPSSGQSCSLLRVRHRAEDRQRRLVVQVRKGLQRLGKVLQQQGAQAAGCLVQRPDRLLVLARQRLDGQGLVAELGQRSVLVPVGAQDVGEDRGVDVVGLLTGLEVALPVPGDSARVDRVDGESGCPQREDEQVLVGLHRHGSHVGRSAVSSDQLKEFGEAGNAGVDASALQHLPVLVHHHDVVVVLGPIDPARSWHCSSGGSVYGIGLRGSAAT